MIESMEKDTILQTTFDRYFAGAQLPPCDLSKAKRIVSARARERRVGGIVAAAVSSVATLFACIIISIVFALRSIMGWWDNRLPDVSGPAGYLLADTTSTAASYFELKDKYAVMRSFAPFSLASNADAQYTLYYAEDKEVLLRADLKYRDGMTSFSATVWCDLTEGEYSAEDFKEYRALPMGAGSYRAQMEYLNGEYVSRAYMMKNDTEYVIDMTSPQRDSLDRLVSMLQK